MGEVTGQPIEGKTGARALPLQDLCSGWNPLNRQRDKSHGEQSETAREVRALYRNGIGGVHSVAAVGFQARCFFLPKNAEIPANSPMSIAAKGGIAPPPLPPNEGAREGVNGFFVSTR